MSAVTTTRMSSKGQVVIPEQIRNNLGFVTGQEFIVLGERDSVILKMISPVSMQDFDSLISKSRKMAKKHGLKKEQVAKAISKARKVR